MAPRKTGEFERIDRIFAPLAAAWPGALGLHDDAAILTPAEGCDIVVTMDSIVAGVHFIGDEPADVVGRKLLRVNLSDLAAMGARPRIYTLSVALPDSIADDWLEAFAAGLASDQQEFGIVLAGGDSVSTPGPMTLTVTALGEVPHGQALRRDGARPGDALFVTGSIGDGALGLRAARNEFPELAKNHVDYLVDRYRMPWPRLTVGQGLIGLASAAIDVSDGLIGDLRHVTEASAVAAVVEMPTIPLSPAAATVSGNSSSLHETILTGGDDYELLFTAPPNAVGPIAALSRESGVPIVRIGSIGSGTGIRVLDEARRKIALSTSGYTHG